MPFGLMATIFVDNVVAPTAQGGFKGISLAYIQSTTVAKRYCYSKSRPSVLSLPQNDSQLRHLVSRLINYVTCLPTI
jgi:hypothetical protein